MRLADLERDYHVGFRHNPKQFYPNSFRIEVEGRRLILIGAPKRHLHKRFRVVAILKPRKN